MAAECPEDRLERVEGKVDDLGKQIVTVVGDVRSIREKLEVRELLEKQAQIMTAEVNAAKALLAQEKASNAEDWNRMKTKALYVLVGLCLLVSFPGLAGMARTLKAMVP